MQPPGRTAPPFGHETYGGPGESPKPDEHLQGETVRCAVSHAGELARDAAGDRRPIGLCNHVVSTYLPVASKEPETGLNQHAHVYRAPVAHRWLELPGPYGFDGGLVEAVA